MDRGSIDIRLARSEDEEATLDLLEELFEPPGRRPQDYTRARGREGFRHCLQRPDADVLLALESHTVVGLASVYAGTPFMRFGRRCWLEDLVVASSRRSEGIGKRLLETAAEWARKQGCTHLELESGVGRKDAHRFYISNGMEQGSLSFSRPV